MQTACTKSTCPAQPTRSCADCGGTAARAKPINSRSAETLDFKVAALESVDQDVALVHQLTDREFRLLYALFKRAAAARKERAR